jgi:hypothetical protein
VLLEKYYYDDHIEEDVIGRGYSMRGNAVHTKFWQGNLKAKDHQNTWMRMEDNIKMDHEETGCESVDWIHLAQEKAQ